MTIADDVVWQCAESAGAVDVVNSYGQRSRGPRRLMDVERQDESGLTRMATVTVLSVPTPHLDKTALEGTVRVTEDTGRVTSYLVKDILHAEDGRLKRLVVVVA